MQLLVFGMHRSGTSMVARLLNMMGAYFAPEGVSNGANAENPKGFWERRDVRNLNNLVLRAAGADWDQLSGFSLDRIPAETVEQFKREAGQIIHHMDAHRPWFIKEPRLCVLAPLWLELLEFPVCVFVHRSPLEVARSLEMRNQFPIAFGLALWERYNTAALNATQGLKRVQSNYAQLISEPVAAVQALLKDLEAIGVRGLSLPSPEEILSFVDPSLHRAKERETKGKLSPAQRRLQLRFEKNDALTLAKPIRFSRASQELLEQHDQSCELQRLRGLVVEREAEVRTWKTRAERREAGLAVWKSRAEHIGLDTKRLRDEVEAARARLNAAREEAAKNAVTSKMVQETLQREMKLLRQAAKADATNREIRTLTNDIEDFKSRLRSASARIAALKKTVQRRDTEVANTRRQLDEITGERRLLKQALDAIEVHFRQLLSSRSFYFVVYTARRLGLVSRNPRRHVEKIRDLFPKTRKALKKAKAMRTPPLAPLGGNLPIAPVGAVRGPELQLVQAVERTPERIAQAMLLRQAAAEKHVISIPATALASDASVCCIVLHHSGEHHLRNLFSSFLRFNSHPAIEFCVVLHACTDNSRDVIAEFKERLSIRVIDHPDNHSFSQSNNRAAEQTQADYLVFLNNDIIFRSDVLPQLLGCLQAGKVGLAGTRLLYPDDFPTFPGEIQHAGIKFRPDPISFFFRPYNLGASTLISDTPRVAEKFPAVTAALIACRRRDFLAVGGFCEDYIYGYEDVDLGLTFRRRLALHSVSANHLECIHNESASGRLHLSQVVEQQRLNNIGHLLRRHGWYLRRKCLADKISGRAFFSEVPFTVAFAVTEADAGTAAGDFFSASELAEACASEFGWTIRYLARNEAWYDLKDVDVLIVMVDAYELAKIRNPKPDLLKVAWLRNWFERWASRPDFDQYDLFLCSSAKSAQWLWEVHHKSSSIFPLATNPARFTPAPPDPRFQSDYCFTGNYWQFDREIGSVVQPQQLESYKFSVFGQGWETHPRLRDYSRGFLPYAEMPAVYASTRVVIDDANHVTKDWGSINSRVYDALAAGALVITNNTVGAAEVFAGELPAYASPEEFHSLLNRYLGDEQARRALVDRLRERVLRQHTYQARARTLKRVLIARARNGYRIALKIGAPTRDEMKHWGDYHFAHSLGRYLAAHGHTCRIDCLDEWHRPESFGDDVVIALRGLTRYRPQPGQINLIWNISHPDLVEDQEYNEFDHVFVASDSHAAALARRLRTSVDVLLQCTDPDVFFPDPSPEVLPEELLFVGNSRKQYREAVRYAVEAEMPIGVYGTHWQMFIPADYIRGEYVANSVLRQHYSRCGILVNDHWPSMREHGFISNRLFDAAAAGAFVLSDQIEGGADIFGEELVTYGSESQFRDLARYYLSHPEERRSRAERMRLRVLEAHTFAHRAGVLVTKIKQLDEQKRGTGGLDATAPGNSSGRHKLLPTANPQLISQPRIENDRSRSMDLARMTIAIKTSVPSLEEAPSWGDHHFALALQRALNRLGHSCRIDMNPEWRRNSDEGDDVTLTLRGRHRYKPDPRCMNLMWNISHPDRIIPGEYEEFDHVFVASHSYARELCQRLGTRVSALLQCTDPDLFFPDPRPQLKVDELLFVGNSRKVYRPIVKDAVVVGLPLAVYGSLWEEFLPPGHLKGSHIDNRVLRHYYSSCKILFNDHWKTMAQSGFLSNRLFDAGACEACVISDEATGLEEVFNGSVLTYGTQQELREMVDYFLEHDEERRQKGRELRDRISSEHTFDRRAEQIIDVILRLVPDKSGQTGRNNALRSGREVPVARVAHEPEQVKLDAKGQWSSRRVRYSFNYPTVWPKDVSEITVRGWCFPNDGNAHGIRLRHGGGSYEGAYGLERRDVAKAFPEKAAVALQSGFEIRAKMPFLRNLITFEFKDERGEWVPFHIRSISSWRAHFRPAFAAWTWLSQLDARDRTLWYAQRESPFHQIIRDELASTLDKTFWSTLRASESAGRALSASLPARESDAQPLVSIVMPTYNRADLIQEAIKSVRAQSWSNWELHVCDDGSEDDTESVIAGVADPRIKFHKLSHAGAAAARNQGLARASGRYIAYLDTDNIWHPDYLLMMVGLLESRPDHFSAYCKYLDAEVGVKGNYRLAAYRDLPFDHARLSSRNFVDLNGFVHRIELYRELGGFTEHLIRLQDWDLAVRYMFYKDPLYLDQFLVIYRRSAKWDQLTFLHEHRSGPRQIVRENIWRLYSPDPDPVAPVSGRDGLQVQVALHAKTTLTPGFAGMVSALARYCEVGVLIAGSSNGRSLESLFFGTRVTFAEENRAPELTLPGRGAGVLLVQSCDDFACELARQANVRTGVAIIIDNGGHPSLFGRQEREDRQLTPPRYRIVRPWDERTAGQLRLNPAWDERIVRPQYKLPSGRRDLYLLLDDHVLQEAEANEIRAEIESLPGRRCRVGFLSAFHSLQDVLNGIIARPLSSLPRADAYLLWRDESARDAEFYSGLPLALALRIPVLSNQSFDQLDPEPARFAKTVEWKNYAAVQAQMDVLDRDSEATSRLTAHGEKLFMRRFAAKTLGRVLAIYCRIAAGDRQARQGLIAAEDAPMETSSPSMRGHEVEAAAR